MTVKSSVLEILENNRGASVSGEDMAEQLSVTRNAVWKAVSSLRNDGYSILSATNKGYMLTSDCDMVSVEGIRVLMSHDIPVICHSALDSTNAEARRYIAGNDCDRLIITADEQTNGRGRLGRSFYSPADTGVYMSYVFSPDVPAVNAVSVTTASAAAIAAALERLCGKQLSIKWVNDLYIDGKKVCGILTEAMTSCETGIVEHIIIGVGINVTTHRFPRNIRKKAGSLNPHNVTRNAVIATVADALCEMSDRLGDRSYIGYYREHMLMLGKEIEYTENGITHIATAIGIDDSGGLEVTDSTGMVKILRSGEITLREI